MLTYKNKLPCPFGFLYESIHPSIDLSNLSIMLFFLVTPLQAFAPVFWLLLVGRHQAALERTPGCVWSLLSSFVCDLFLEKPHVDKAAILLLLALLLWGALSNHQQVRRALFQELSKALLVRVASSWTAHIILQYDEEKLVPNNLIQWLAGKLAAWVVDSLFRLIGSGQP